MAKKESKPKKEASKPLAKKNPFAQPAYQKIVRAFGENENFYTDFEDGSRSVILKDELYRYGKYLMDNPTISKNGKMLSIPIGPHSVEIPWSRIRELSDPAFRKSHDSIKGKLDVDWIKLINTEIKRRNWNFVQVEAAGGLGHGTLNYIVTQKRKPHYDTILCLLTAFGMTWADLDRY